MNLDSLHRRWRKRFAIRHESPGQGCVTFRGQSSLLIPLVWLALLLGAAASTIADDWPMYRRDSGRRGVTSERLPGDLTLAWTRQLPELRPAFRDARLQFDAGYEPVVADGHLLLASSRTDSVKAYDARSGRERWCFYANGPVRLAPAISQGLACFGSDDGFMYCVELATGRLRWKHRAVPSQRRLLGNQRLISVWPVRGGPVIQDGVVYFAAGVWPFEGVFVYAMELNTGKVLWRNDRMGHRFGQQPHNTQAIGGLAPQGYLLVNGDELIVPCSNAYPARLDRRTGELISFELPSAGRYPGGWFAALDPDEARALRRGKLTFDDTVNRQQHEGGWNTSRGGVKGLSREIRAGQETLNFDEDMDGVDGPIHSMAIADGSLFVTTRAGRVSCFRAAESVPSSGAKVWPMETHGRTLSADAAETAHAITERAGSDFGVAIVVGLKDGTLVRSLIESSQYHVVAFDEDQGRVDQLRSELDRVGLSGRRAAVWCTDLSDLQLPPYIATVLTSERTGLSLEPWVQTLRPFGGLVAGAVAIDHESLAGKLGRFEAAESTAGLNLMRRVGPLPGAEQYEGDFSASRDQLVRFPLGVLWFDDALAHFKRSPQPVFDRDTMVSTPKDWDRPRYTESNKIDYPLLAPVLSDIYTGRVLDESERPELRFGLRKPVSTELEPSQYRPSGQPFASKAIPRVVGQRLNPLTGVMEERSFPKTYGCDGGVDYGDLFTLRSGTAAYYDKTLESGTVFLSGPRSGCTNSIIPSGGVLNVPYYYAGCTCSYPLPVAMSLVSMPARHEQWSSWGTCELKPGTVERIGINFGAPGDRVTREGTLWLDHPSVGGPSPQIDVETQGDLQYEYRHSLFMKGQSSTPWVGASLARGLQRLVIKQMKAGNYRVRLHFAEPRPIGDQAATATVQDIRLQGRTVESDFDVTAQAGGTMRSVVKSYEGIGVTSDLTLELSAAGDQTVISGVELIRQ